MTKTYCIDRFDQYDYQKFGLTDRWKLGDAVDLFVNFYMESKRLHDSADSLEIINKQYGNYYEFLSGNLSAKNISYLNIYNEADDLRDHDGEVIGDSFTTLDKYELLEYLDKNNALKLDIELLKRFISGDEKPSTPLSAVMAISESKPDVEITIAKPTDEDIPEDIKGMTLPFLRKKVAELTNEKDKWDKSILAALNVGLKISAKELVADITEKAFAAEFEKEFKGLPKTTVSKIHKALPVNYRNIGGSPAKESGGIDDDTLDTIIEASLATGLICSEEEISNGKELEAKLAGLGIDVPPYEYLKAISGASKRVTKKYNESLV